MTNNQNELSPTELSDYEECKAIFLKGPHTAEIIGEALWRIQDKKLFRGQYKNIETFLDRFIKESHNAIKIDDDNCLNIIKQWTQPPKGQAFTSQSLAKDSVNNAPAGAVVDTQPASLPPQVLTKAKESVANDLKNKPNTALDSATQNKQQSLGSRKAQGGVKMTTGEPPKTTSPTKMPSTFSVKADANQPAVKRIEMEPKPAPHTVAAKAMGQPKASSGPTMTGQTPPPSGQKPVGSPAPNKDKAEAVRIIPQGNVNNQPRGNVSGDKTSGDPVGHGPDAPVTGTASGQFTVTRLKLSDIKVDRSIQSRAQVNKTVITQYSERMKAGDVFPPLDVFHVDGIYLLTDGGHRYCGAELAGLEEFAVKIHYGTRRDAITFSIEANTAHGLPQTNKDKRRSVELALKEMPDLSDGLVASLCRVSQPFVSKLKHQLITVMSSDPKMGKDGKKRKQATTRSSSKEEQPSSSENAKKSATAANDKKTDNTEKPSAKEKQQAKPAVATAQNKKFDFNETWGVLEDYLFIELEKWPEEHRRHLGSKLRSFADANCV